MERKSDEGNCCEIECAHRFIRDGDLAQPFDRSCADTICQEVGLASSESDEEQDNSHTYIPGTTTRKGAPCCSVRSSPFCFHARVTGTEGSLRSWWLASAAI
jgi:hypothetical protein